MPASALLRISGCLISPPTFAALAISPMVTTDSSSTAAVFPAPDEVRRREYHRPYHAATPVASMKINASNAERWCRSITPCETPGILLTDFCAE